MFENHRKSLIQHCERSELCLHFEWTKLNFKCQKKSILAIFWKLETCGQTVLPDRLVVIEQKLWGFQIFRVIFNPMQFLVIWKLHLYIWLFKNFKVQLWWFSKNNDARSSNQFFNLVPIPWTTHCLAFLFRQMSHVKRKLFNSFFCYITILSK